MLEFLKKKKMTWDIVAPVSGEIVDISTLPDDMFAKKVLGESTAVKVNDDYAEICAPVDGILKVVFPTGHAFGMLTKEGIEVLVHIGINTVEEDGNGFLKLKSQEDTVTAGTPIIAVDFAKLRSKYDMSVIIIITNQNGNTIELVNNGKCLVGQSIVKKHQ